MSNEKVRCVTCGSDRYTRKMHDLEDIYWCSECQLSFDYPPLKVSEPTERIPFSERVGFYNGWVAATASTQSQELVDCIDAIIEYAREYKAAAPIPYVKLKADNERLNKLVYDLSKPKEETVQIRPDSKDSPFKSAIKAGATMGTLDAETKVYSKDNLPPCTYEKVKAPWETAPSHVEQVNNLDKEPEDKTYLPEDKPLPDLQTIRSRSVQFKESVIEALRTKTISGDLYPKMHEVKPYCYKCMNLADIGQQYPFCVVHNTGIRAAQAWRQCDEYVKAALKDQFYPKFRCSRCVNLNKDSKKCGPLGIYVKNMHENKYGMCPFWKSKFNEPVKVTSQAKKEKK